MKLLYTVTAGALVLAFSASGYAQRLNPKVEQFNDDGGAIRKKFLTNIDDPKWKGQESKLKRIEFCIRRHLEIKGVKWRQQAQIQTNIGKILFIKPEEAAANKIFGDGLAQYNPEISRPGQAPSKPAALYVVVDNKAARDFAPGELCHSELLTDVYSVIDNELIKQKSASDEYGPTFMPLVSSRGAKVFNQSYGKLLEYRATYAQEVQKVDAAVRAGEMSEELAGRTKAQLYSDKAFTERELGF